MKKYIFLALLTMGVSSCQLVDVLDQKPEFEADLDGAITTPAAVELALNGIYYSLPGNGFNVIFPTVSGSFKAGTMWRQEIVSAGNAVYYSERMLPTLSFSDATEWDADYAVIKNANFLETACNRMSDGEFSGNRRAEVLGEIAYLRALAYFNILVRYCEFWDMNSEYGVVMRNEAPSVSNALKARSSVADSYQYILDQLEIAIEKAPDWKKLSQASKEAAKALKARVLLYAGKYTEAVAAVNDAIDTNSPLPEANYGDVFDKFSTTKEILFARVFDQKDATNTSTRQQCYGNSPTKKQGYWGPTNEYVELVGDDPRADAIFSKVDSLMDSRSSAVAYNLKSVKKLLNDANAGIGHGDEQKEHVVEGAHRHQQGRQHHKDEVEEGKDVFAHDLPHRLGGGVHRVVCPAVLLPLFYLVQGEPLLRIGAEPGHLPPGLGGRDLRGRLLCVLAFHASASDFLKIRSDTSVV